MNAAEFVKLLDLTYVEVLNSDIIRRTGAVDLKITEHTAAMEYPELGFSIAFKEAEWTTLRGHGEEFVVVGIHVFVAPIEGYKCFDGGLIHGLMPSNSRHDVRRGLGPPAASGGGARGMFNRWIDDWDRFDFDKYSVRLEYGATGIKLLVIMKPAADKRLA